MHAESAPFVRFHPSASRSRGAALCCGAAQHMSGAGTSTLHERGVLQGHKGSVNVARFNRDGKYCLTGGDDRRVILWNPYKDPGEEIVPIKEYAIHSKQVLDVAVADDNASFASCGGDKTVFVWDVGSGRVLRRLVGHEHWAARALRRRGALQRARPAGLPILI